MLCHMNVFQDRKEDGMRAPTMGKVDSLRGKWKEQNDGEGKQGSLVISVFWNVCMYIHTTVCPSVSDSFCSTPSDPLGTRTS